MLIKSEEVRSDIFFFTSPLVRTINSSVLSKEVLLENFIFCCADIGECKINNAKQIEIYDQAWYYLDISILGQI